MIQEGENRIIDAERGVKFIPVVLMLFCTVSRAEAQGEAWRVRLEQSVCPLLAGDRPI